MATVWGQSQRLEPTQVGPEDQPCIGGRWTQILCGVLGILAQLLLQGHPWVSNRGPQLCQMS